MSHGLGTLAVVAALSVVAACAPIAVQPKVSLAGTSVVRIQVIGNVTLVSVTVNRNPQVAVFVVDTGATSTIITPLLGARLGLSVPMNAVRRELRVIGGQAIMVPFIQLATLQVGEATVEGLEVGIYDIMPDARVIDGLLGGDFLHRFKVTLDRRTSRMVLEPISP